jgi:hypothetical protein
MASTSYVSILPSTILESNFVLRWASGDISGRIFIFDTVELGSIVVRAQNHFEPFGRITQGQRVLLDDTIKRGTEFHVTGTGIVFNNVHITKEDFETISKMFEDSNLKELEITAYDFNISCFNGQDVINAEYEQELIDGLTVDPTASLLFMYSAPAWEYISGGYVGYGG